MRATLTPGWNNNLDNVRYRWLTIFGRLPANGDVTAIRPLFSTVVRDHVEQAKITNANARQRVWPPPSPWPRPRQGSTS